MIQRGQSSPQTVDAVYQPQIKHVAITPSQPTTSLTKRPQPATPPRPSLARLSPEESEQVRDLLAQVIAHGSAQSDRDSKTTRR